MVIELSHTFFSDKIANSNSTMANVSQCQQIEKYYKLNETLQLIFIAIGKYLIIIPAGINILREVRYVTGYNEDIKWCVISHLKRSFWVS